MFDVARFGRLAAAAWLENRRAWAWFLGIGIIVHFVLMLLMLMPQRGFEMLRTDMQGVVYFTGLFTTAPIFANRYFAAMGRRESALLLLMRPASTFEKWLLAFVVVAILYPVAYTLAFQVCNVPAATIAEAIADAPGRTQHGAAPEPDAFAVYFPWVSLREARQWTVVLLPLLTVQGFGLLGALYFRSMAFLKTVLAGFLVLLVVMLASTLASSPELFFGYWIADTPLLPWQRVFLPAVWIAVPVLLWLGSLLALREREVS